MKFDTFLRKPNQMSMFSQKKKKTHYTLFPLGLGEWLSFSNLKGKKKNASLPWGLKKNDTYPLPLTLVIEYLKILTDSFYQSFTIVSKIAFT